MMTRWLLVETAVSGRRGKPQIIEKGKKYKCLLAILFVLFCLLSGSLE